MAEQPATSPDQLLPTRWPRAGLIRQYTGSQSGRPMLRRSVQIDAAEARKLAGAVNHVSLTPPRGTFSCPADSFGSETVIAFEYAAGRSTDLWYHTSGCRTLDNGAVSAFQGANPSFYNGFQSVFDALLPQPAH